MIIYSKTLWGIPLLTRIYGSALPRALAPAVISGLLTVVLLLLGDRVRHLWNNPFAYQPFVLIVSFVLTFRSNYAYQRHWEAYTQMQIMTARWLDAAVQIIMFDKHPLEHNNPQQQQQQQHGISGSSAVSRAAAVQSHQQFVAELVHLISLLHAVACAALRRDPDLGNLTRHSRLSSAPPSDPALLDRTTLPGSSSSTGGVAAAEAADEEPGSPRTSGLMQWASYSDANIVGAANWRDIFMLRGSSNTIRKYNAAQPLPIIAGLSKQEAAALGCRHDCHHELELDEAAGLCTAETWGGVVTGRYPTPAAAAAAVHVKQRRTTSNTAVVNMVPTGQLGSSSSSYLWGFLRHNQQQQQRGVLTQRSHSVANPSVHYSAAGSVKSNKSGNGGKPLLTRSMTRRFKVSQNHACCVGHLPYMDRPMLVLAWVHELLLQRQETGGLRIPAPILSRVHTCLSDGLLGFEQCRKLADTPFPFPWAQFVLVMLVLFTVTLPLLVLAYVSHSVLAVVITVMTVTTYWAVNEVARDVEDPFLYEPNDMPLANSQYHINEMLLALSAAERPASGVMPVHFPMAAAAAAAGSARVGSVPIRSAASASWPDLRAAAAAPAPAPAPAAAPAAINPAACGGDDTSCHHDKATNSHHRLATILSGDPDPPESQTQFIPPAAAAATPFAVAVVQDQAASLQQQQQEVCDHATSGSSGSADIAGRACPSAAAAAAPAAADKHIRDVPDDNHCCTDTLVPFSAHAKRVMLSSSAGGSSSSSRERTTGGVAASMHTDQYAGQLNITSHGDHNQGQVAAQAPQAAAAAAAAVGGRSSLGGDVQMLSLKASTPAAAASGGDGDVVHQGLDDSSTVADMV